MGQKREKVKKHFQDNKKLYIGVGIGVAVGAAVVLILKDDLPSDLDVLNYNKPVLNWRPENTQVIVNMIERSTPSKPVHLKGTNLYFDSLSEAARQTGYSLSQISRQINGHIPDINGDIFELLEKSA